MAKVAQYAPTPIRLFPVSDFQGGLNLRADAFQLGHNESPDMMDMTVETGGGFVQRLAVAPYGSTINTTSLGVWAFTAPAVQQVIIFRNVLSNFSFWYSSGGAWTSFGPGFLGPFPAGFKPRATVFRNNMYFVFGAVAAPIRWTGSVSTSLTQTYNETMGSEGANDGNMPYAKYICSHMGSVFIAYTTESGVDFPNRIRWSHAGFSEDWRAEDFIDIDVGRDGDYITGICEFRDRLYIFKNNSISILTGYGPQNFQVTTLSQEIGAVSQEAILVTEVGLFNFSWPQGVYLDRGSGPYPIFDKLWPLVRDGLIPSAYKSQIAMGWVNKNLWLAVPYGTSTSNTRVYVYNPWIWKNRYLRFLQGPWYPYNLPINAFATMAVPDGSTTYLASTSAASSVIGIGKLEQNSSTDNWGGGATAINSYFRTRWYDLGDEAVIKRWRHPDFAMRSDNSAAVLVEVRKDYDPSLVYKSFQVIPKVQSLGMIWDDGSGTIGGKWDDGSGTVGGVFSPLTTNAEAIVRGGSMGSARAVQLSLYAPASQTWGVDAITFKYIPKRVRG